MAASAKPIVKLSRRMSTQDASFIYGETRGGPLHIGALNFFDATIDYDEIIDHMAQRMHLLPRYRQRLAPVSLNLAHATLEDDPDFDLRNHIKRHSLPDGTDDRSFVRAAMAAFEPRLERDRPLWEMHLFHGLAGGRSAVLWKVHHCLIDGVSGMELLNVALDLSADAPPPEPPEVPWQAPPMPGAARRVAKALVDRARKRLNEARRLAGLVAAPRAAIERAATIGNSAATIAAILGRRIVAAPWNAGLVGPTRALAWLKVSFADLRAIRNALGGTVNDVVLAILSEAAARYLQAHRVRTGGAPFRIGCPVNVRRTGQKRALGNRVSMMFPELSSAPIEAGARLRAVMDETDRIRRAEEARALEQLIGLGELVPPALMRLSALIGTNAMELASRLGALAPALARMAPLPPPGINFIATNVPGAQAPLYLAGREMVEMVGLAPLTATLGYSVAIVSYNQALVFGMMAESRLMPDVERMRDFAADVFAELMAAARMRRGAAPASRARRAA